MVNDVTPVRLDVEFSEVPMECTDLDNIVPMLPCHAQIHVEVIRHHLDEFGFGVHSGICQ